MFIKLGLADPTNGGGMNVRLFLFAAKSSDLTHRPPTNLCVSYIRTVEPPRFYRCLFLRTDGAISYLKRHAVLLARGETNGDIRDVNLNDYSVRLYYTDPQGDKIFLYSDLDVKYATRLRTTTVKITAKVDDTDDSLTLMTATPSTAETAIPTTTETGTPQPAAK
jgi:hypothetical protein